MAKARYAACIAHRVEAQRRAEITDKQKAALSLGRVKGDNRRLGYQHRADSKIKTSISNLRFWSANPDRLAERGAKTRGDLHYLWNGGSSNLNKSIRQMTENRRWMDAVKERDGFRCVRCNSADLVESHHIKGLSELIGDLGITSRDDARKHADTLWNLANGETLCRSCHYAEHGRRMAA